MGQPALPRARGRGLTAAHLVVQCRVSGESSKLWIPSSQAKWVVQGLWGFWGFMRHRPFPLLKPSPCLNAGMS